MRRLPLMFALTAVALTACNNPSDSKTTTPSVAAQSATTNKDAVIKLGLAVPLTGPQSHIGKDYENGARMAIDDANQAGFKLNNKLFKLELVVEDDQADPKNATTIAQKFVDQKINGIIGHLNSGTCIPASKIYADAGIPQITASATATAYTTQGFKTTFRLMANDAQQGTALGVFAVNHLGAKNIALIDDRTAYGQGLADEFEKSVKAAGGHIITRQYTTDKATDFAAILTLIKGKKPDLIFYGGIDAQAAPMVKQLKQLGIDAKYMAGDGIRTPEFTKIAGQASEGVYASQPGLPLEEMPKGQTFQQQFKAKYGDIVLFSPYTYDAVNVMLNAMKKANSSDPKQYATHIHQSGYHGVVAHAIEFDEKGDLKNAPITLYQVKHGQWSVTKNK